MGCSPRPHPGLWYSSSSAPAPPPPLLTSLAALLTPSSVPNLGSNPSPRDSPAGHAFALQAAGPGSIPGALCPTGTDPGVQSGVTPGTANCGQKSQNQEENGSQTPAQSDLEDPGPAALWCEGSGAPRSGAPPPPSRLPASVHPRFGLQGFGSLTPIPASRDPPAPWDSAWAGRGRVYSKCSVSAECPQAPLTEPAPLHTHTPHLNLPGSLVPRLCRAPCPKRSLCPPWAGPGLLFILPLGGDPGVPCRQSGVQA